jgi:hypothetical protein
MKKPISNASFRQHITVIKVFAISLYTCCFWIVFIAMHLQKNISLFIYLQKKSACINS